MVNTTAHIHIETPWLTKERFVAGGAAAVAVAGGVILGIRLGFHHHAPEQAAVPLAFHQQATNQVGRGAEERLREDCEILGGRGCSGDEFCNLVMRKVHMTKLASVEFTLLKPPSWQQLH